MNTEKRPRDNSWSQTVAPATCGGGRILSAWARGRLVVISELASMELPGGGTGPTWFISVSHAGGRPNSKHIRKALRSFRMRGAEEDNHYPGVTRGFFMPVDPSSRADCDCKLTEATIVEPDGFTWTNPNDGSGCRGCELWNLTGRPCPLHTAPPLEATSC